MGAAAVRMAVAARTELIEVRKRIMMELTECLDYLERGIKVGFIF